MDRSQSVNAAVGDTERTLAIAVVLVIGVVFVFLQSAQSIWIPAVALRCRSSARSGRCT